jgi:hypothetical protein
VKHCANSRFWRCYRGLPKEIRDLADRNYSLLKSDPAHNSLNFKKAGPLWSIRVGLHYRALATQAEDNLVWFGLGLMRNMTGSWAENRPTGHVPQAARKRRPSRAGILASGVSDRVAAMADRRVSNAANADWN